MSASLAYPVRTPQWVLTYAGVNISGDISGMVREIIYTDRLSGAAGEIEVELEDHDKLWQGPWFPQDGDLTNLNLDTRMKLFCRAVIFRWTIWNSSFLPTFFACVVSPLT